MRTRKRLLSAMAVLTGAVMLLHIPVSAAEQTTRTEVLLGNTTVMLSDIDFTPAAVLSNADSGFLFGDQLDANNRTSYEAFEDYLANPSDDTMTIELTDPIVLQRSSSNMANWSEDEYTEYASAVMSAVMPGAIACTLDYPELFWLNFTEIACNLPSGQPEIKGNFGSSYKYTITISKLSVTPNYDTSYTDFDEILEIRDQIDQAAQNFIIEGDTDYEKCQSIYKSICDIITYDTTAPYAHSVAGVLYDTNAVCEGYAKTFKLLCDREDIPCLAVLGNFDSENMTAHMWNYVYLDNAWYACDPTWDDALSGTDYFMRGSAVFNQNHTPESPYSIMEMYFPELSEEDYSPASGTETTTTTTETTTTTTETTSTTTTMETTTTSTATNTETTTVGSTTEMTTASASETTPATETTVTTTVTADVPVPLYGDVNEDGVLSLLDVIVLRKYLVGAVGTDACPLLLADTNQDRSVNVFDAAYLLRCIADIR
ncbi:MAG: hypothetical protein IJ512_07840 [Ruminococcus sp.]|nr:hypothetical protein [Ruminococcus sp.]